MKQVLRGAKRAQRANCSIASDGRTGSGLTYEHAKKSVVCRPGKGFIKEQSRGYRFFSQKHYFFSFLFIKSNLKLTLRLVLQPPLGDLPLLSPRLVLPSFLAVWRIYYTYMYIRRYTVSINDFNNTSTVGYTLKRTGPDLNYLLSYTWL